MEEIFGPEACGAGVSLAALLWAIVALGVAVVGVVMALARSPRAMLVGFVALLLSGGPVAAGFFMRHELRKTVDRALESPGLKSTERETLKVAGYHRAEDCLMMGGVLAGLPALLSFIALSVVFRREDRGLSFRLDRF